MDLTIVIPTYNEAENIPILVERIFRVFREHSLDGEVIIVDDDSPDCTWEVVQKLRSIYNNLELLRRVDKRGLSSSVLDGIDLSKGKVIGVMDADLSHLPEKIPELLKPITNGESDFVIGSRYMKGGKIVEWPFKRKFASKLATLAAIGLTKVKDPMSGFFFFTKTTVEGVEISTQVLKICLEILVKGKYNNVIEIPIVFSDRKYGESKLTLSVILGYFYQLAKLYAYKFLKKS